MKTKGQNQHKAVFPGLEGTVIMNRAHTLTAAAKSVNVIPYLAIKSTTTTTAATACR